MLKGKNVLLGVTGGISAYKSADIVSRLIKLGAEVQVIMTRSATQIITPLTLRTLSKKPVVVDMFAEPNNWEVQHISFADKADLCLIAPATANIIGKIAHGIADDMLSTTVMAVRSPIVLAPAMNVHMYENKIVQRNIDILKKEGYHFIEPDVGVLACGYEGKGRMAAPERIVEEVVRFLINRQDLTGKKILITAGPTREPIDPVRYLTNRSSGKMGYALAEAAKLRGAQVILISGPTHINFPSGVNGKIVETTEQMREAVLAHFDEVDVVIKAAAVLDYRPVRVAEEKIKKSGENLNIELAPNPDILYELGEKKSNQILVGFAAETENLLRHAEEKLKRKNLDMIVANDVSVKDAGFDVDNNRVKIIMRKGKVEETPLLPKIEVAHIILDRIVELLKCKSVGNNLNV